MKYVIELSEKDFDNIKHAYTAIFGDIYHIMQGAIANGKALEQKPDIDKIRAEIGKSKTEHEMQIAERDIKAKLLISNIYCDIVNILDKYKVESEG